MPPRFKHDGHGEILTKHLLGQGKVFSLKNGQQVAWLWFGRKKFAEVRAPA
ncbi:hypothetical protein [Erwinia typographi]|uniref:hypothetical protein n=1 Tax=Erwinia typographi TaxID=371042 RepID=UPI000A5B6677|nr:hypothetical protein [Erwinia typographi]